MSFDQQFVNLVEEEFSTPFEGGSGYYVTGEVKVEWGWKVFRAGMSQTDSFVPFVFNNRESVAAAKTQLIERVVALGGTGKGKEAPKQAVRVTIMKSSVLDVLDNGASKGANWKEDRIYDVNTHVAIKEGDDWKTVQSRQYREVLLPSIDHFLSVEDLGEWLWLSVGLRGEDTVTASGEKKTRFTPFVMARFKNEEEAKAAVESGDPIGHQGVVISQPNGWDTNRFGEWADTVAYVSQQFEDTLPHDAAVPLINRKVAELVASYKPSGDGDVSMLTNAFLEILEKRASNVPF